MLQCVPENPGVGKDLLKSTLGTGTNNFQEKTIDKKEFQILYGKR